MSSFPRVVPQGFIESTIKDATHVAWDGSGGAHRLPCVYARHPSLTWLVHETPHPNGYRPWDFMGMTEVEYWKMRFLERSKDSERYLSLLRRVLKDFNRTPNLWRSMGYPDVAEFLREEGAG